jgi:exonuclease SbcC
VGLSVDINELNEMLKQYFQKINQIIRNKHVIRCEKKYKNETYEIYYFDFSENWIKQDFDLNNYLCEFIKDDYYSNPGYLQWNYYLILLKETDIETENKTIENNEEFARKFVIEYKYLSEWLENRFNFPLINEPIIGGKDLSLIWMEKLKENDLDCVYLGNISYDKGFNSFLEGCPIKDMEEVDDSEAFDFEDDNVTHITSLCLENYRKSPRRKNFDFGKVNLLVGNNGTGKTSLLEAIELFTCGKNFRNPKKVNISTSIKVLYKDESFYRNIDLKNNTKYRKRNALWYSNFEKNKNNLYISFNRFNFYNTDAALSLSNDRGSSEEILKAFQDIVLGPKVNYIDERLKKYSKLFGDELKRCSKTIDEYKKELNNETESIKELKNGNNSLELLFGNFIKELEYIGWKYKYPTQFNNDLVKFESDYITLSNYLTEILQSVDWIEDLTLELLEFDKSKTNELDLSITTLNDKTHELEQEIEHLELYEKLLKSKIENSNKLQRYLSNVVTAELIGLDKRIEELQSKDVRYQKIINNIKNTDLNLYLKYQDYTLSDLERKLKVEITENEEKESALVEEIDKLEKDLSKMERLLTDIKAKGLELVCSYPNFCVCPLCNTSFEKHELEKIIREKYENIGELSTLKDLLSKHNEVMNKLSNLYNTSQNLELIKDAYFTLESYEYYSDCKLSIIIEKLKAAIKEKSEVSFKLDKLNSLKLDLNSNNFFEQEYILLIEEIEKSSPDIKNKLRFDEITEDYVKDRTRHLNELYEDVSFQHNKCNNELIEQNRLMKEISSQVFNGIVHKDLKSLIQKRLQIINNSLFLLQEVSNFIIIPSNESIKKMKRKLDISYSIFEKFKEEKKQNDHIDIIITRSLSKINEYNRKISQLEDGKIILNKGYLAIEDILIKYGKEKFLDSFFDENKKDILKIFKMIHVPREFENINFDEESHIYLERDDPSEEDAELSTISTGQRSALALSIFLTLNKKLLNGPPYLIFDDPIAYIDDLNVLSFIDYLREITLNTDRQIFFSTANENLAFLFHQKFGFLDDSEFKIYRLMG